ncbi:hypothetical protein [Thalassospira permensis]|uniref:hypothetical protein n=1 Tax=Thalassospira permensis TaxID=680197 RepID=UPI000AA542F0|nr:hypothetical protein [Thalassospira permensis]
MSTELVLKALKGRMPWSVAQKALHLCGLPRGQGWQKTISKLCEETSLYPDEFKKLADYHKQHILFGEKNAHLMKVGTAVREQILSQMRTIEIPNSVVQSSYPFALSEEDMNEAPVGHTLVAHERLKQGEALVYAALRTLVIKEEVLATDFDDVGREILTQYAEVYGTKLVRTFGFDVLWVPYEGEHVDFLVDCPRGMNLVATLNAMESFKEVVKRDLSSIEWSKSENLFPLIKGMYENDDEGIVVELAFGTSTASLKHEKMRRGSISLRDELYHVGGKGALKTPIEPYKISIEWSNQLSSQVYSKLELNLHSNSYEIGTVKPYLKDAVIRGCFVASDYRFVRNRILSYLN